MKKAERLPKQKRRPQAVRLESAFGAGGGLSPAFARVSQNRDGAGRRLVELRGEARSGPARTYETVFYPQIWRKTRETEYRIQRLCEFVNQDRRHLLCVWYASESSHLAEIGGYEVEERNIQNPSYHLDWALSMPPEVVALELVVKYELQAERQFDSSGIDALRWFYGVSAVRLVPWGEIYVDGESQISINHNHYLQQCASWDDQRILEDLSRRVNQVGKNLIEERW